MEHKVFYKIDIYKELSNADGVFNNDEEPIALRVKDEDDMKTIVSAAVLSCYQVVVTVEVD